MGQVTSTLRPLKQQNLTAGCSWGPGWPRPGCRPGWLTPPKARPGPGPPPRPLAWRQDLAPRRPLVSGHPPVLAARPLRTPAHSVAVGVPGLPGEREREGRPRRKPWRPLAGTSCPLFLDSSLRLGGRECAACAGDRWGPPGSAPCSLSCVHSEEGIHPRQRRGAVTGLWGQGRGSHPLAPRS